jgi:hypothetical protein
MANLGKQHICHAFILKDKKQQRCSKPSGHGEVFCKTHTNMYRRNKGKMKNGFYDDENINILLILQKDFEDIPIVIPDDVSGSEVKTITRSQFNVRNNYEYHDDVSDNEDCNISLILENVNYEKKKLNGQQSLKNINRENTKKDLYLWTYDDDDYLIDPITRYIYDFDTMNKIGKRCNKGNLILYENDLNKNG